MQTIFRKLFDGRLKSTVHLSFREIISKTRDP